jgi:aspartokinase
VCSENVFEVGMSTLIMKYGGSSVDTTAALTQILALYYTNANIDRLVLSPRQSVTDA